MTDQTPFQRGIEAALEEVAGLFPIASDEQELARRVAALPDAALRACVIAAVMLDRARQDEPVRFEVDDPALDRLAAATTVEGLRDAAVALDRGDAEGALLNLLMLHRDLQALRRDLDALAAGSATLN